MDREDLLAVIDSKEIIDGAFKILDEKRYELIQEDTTSVYYLVRGTQLYFVAIHNDGKTFCSCKAGQVGRLCKHRVAGVLDIAKRGGDRLGIELLVKIIKWFKQGESDGDNGS